jgi:uncharacterized protein (DUF433 family)
MPITITPTGYPHITRDQNGVLRIDDTGYKAVLLINTYLAQPWTEDAFLEGYPRLTKAQFHAMLAYYYDHQVEIDAEMERRSAAAERLRQEMSDPTLGDLMRERLRQREAASTPT